MDMAQYTKQELARLKLGYILREQPGDFDGGGGVSKRKRELRRGHRQQRREMLDDLGF